MNAKSVFRFCSVLYIYDCFKDKETLGSLIVNCQAEAEAMGYEEIS